MSSAQSKFYDPSCNLDNFYFFVCLIAVASTFNTMFNKNGTVYLFSKYKQIFVHVQYVIMHIICNFKHDDICKLKFKITHDT